MDVFFAVIVIVILAIFLVATAIGVLLGWCIFGASPASKQKKKKTRSQPRQRSVSSPNEVLPASSQAQSQAQAQAEADTMPSASTTQTGSDGAGAEATSRMPPPQEHVRPAARSGAPDRITDPTIPYEDHPIYQLRRYILILAPTSILLAIISVAGPAAYYDDGTPAWLIHLILSIISAAWAFWDFYRWMMVKHKDGDESPKWPFKIIMIGDAVVALVWLWLFLAELGLTDYYGLPFKAYTSVTAAVFW